MNNKKNFPTTASLKKVREIISDASKALGDETRVKAEITIPEGVFGAAGGAAGVGVSLVALYGLGHVGLSAAGITSALAAAGTVVGGGMVAGVFVVAAPVAILGTGGILIARAFNAKQLNQQNQELLIEVETRHSAIYGELSSGKALTDERAEYLRALLVLLDAAAHDLREDVAAA